MAWKGRRYFITGGTGFVGKALVKHILTKRDTMSVLCLTRGHRKDLMTHRKLYYCKGDMVDDALPGGYFTDIIHGACEANDLLQPDQAHYYYTMVEGAKRVMDWAKKVKPLRMLFISSGAIHKGGTYYAQGKRTCESFVPKGTKIARIYSLVGPEMPLDGQYALGRFIGQALRGKIEYYESGSVRSYLHVIDCAQWLSKILDHGRIRWAYEVGSNVAISVSDLAKKVAHLAGVKAEEIKRTDFHRTALYYVPNTTLANKLGCAETVKLEDAILETLAYRRHSDLEPQKAVA